MKVTYTQAESPELLNISEGAKLLGVTNQRFSRAISALEIPVNRKGYVILFPRGQLAAIKRYLNKRKKGGAIKTG